MKNSYLILILLLFSTKLVGQNHWCGSINESNTIPVSITYNKLIIPIPTPVFFHVILGLNGSGNVNDTQLNDQITVLNGAYSETSFSFYLVGITRTTII